VKVTCHGLFRFIFDPGGFRTTNSRSNSLEEGGYDVILKLYPLLRRIISPMQYKEPINFG
jgi:hypothetical protein